VLDTTRFYLQTFQHIARFYKGSASSHLWTLIVKADIDTGFGHSAAKRLHALTHADFTQTFAEFFTSALFRVRSASFRASSRSATDDFNLRASVRSHPLYILLRVRRELCFW